MLPVQSEFACSFYNPEKCDPKIQHCDQEEVCAAANGSGACYAIFSPSGNSTDVLVPTAKGCWNKEDQAAICGESACIGKPNNENAYFCCCKTPYCNLKPVLKQNEVTMRGTVSDQPN